MNAEIIGLAIAIAGARLAGEFAVRLKQPAVLAEILAGIALGPHALGLVDPGEGLHFVAELGAILLLLEVGLHLDLGELRSVGGSALRVALIGMVAPAAFGYPIARAFGESPESSLFIAAALTATSVGVTARVFQEMRILGTSEARTVLGAAVADDVGGLLILAIAVPLTTGAALSAGGIALTAGGAIGFVVVATALAVPLAPRLLGLAARARTDGAIGLTAIALGIGMAGAAGAAGLAPIVGAFVAGLAVAASSQAGDVRRSMQPVAGLLVPTFFLVIGTEVDLTVARDPAVLAAVAALTLTGVAAKVISGAGASVRAGDRLLIGLGMVPRGEVGLIFAGIGLAEGVLGESAHATLVLTVMATTIVAPPLLRARAGAPAPAEEEPLPEGALLDVLRDGDRTTWRLFSQRVDLRTEIGSAAGPILERLADPLADAHPVRLVDDLRRIVSDPYDPAAVVWGRTAADHDVIRVAAMAQDTLPGADAPAEAAAVAVHTGLSPTDVSEVANLVRDRNLLPVAAGRHDATEERMVVDLAARIGDAPRADRLYLLAAAGLRGAPADRARLDTLFRLIRAALARPELTGRDVTTALAQKREQIAQRLGVDPRDADEALERAPRAYLLAFDVPQVARHVRMTGSTPVKGEVRLEAHPVRTSVWEVSIAARDRPGLLASITGAVTAAGGTILRARLYTWEDDLAVGVFDVAADDDLDWEGVRVAAQSGKRAPVEPPDGVVLRIDDDRSPWFTVVEVEAPDAPGVLHRTAATLADAGVMVRAADIDTQDGRAIDRFEVTAGDGGKLSPAQSAALIRAFERAAATKG